MSACSIPSIQERGRIHQSIDLLEGEAVKQETEMEEMLLNASYEEVEQELSKTTFWVKLFIRPCCPRPNAHMAHLKVEALKEMLKGREDFTAEQIATLVQIASEREDWYTHHMVK